MLALADENGNIVESYEYDAWGNVLGIRDGSGTVLSHSEIGNRYLFQGREYDSTTGLYYFRARWYNPETGRWLSKDPIGIAGGLNLYVFCGNNPVNFVGPSGLCEERPDDRRRRERLERRLESVIEALRNGCERQLRRALRGLEDACNSYVD